MWDYLENQAHLHPCFQMESWVPEGIRGTRVRRERRVTAGRPVLQDCLGGQDLWVQKVNPSWVLKGLWVLRADLDLLGTDVLDLEGPLALLVPQDLHMEMSVSPDLLVPPDHRDLQVMPAR